MWSDINININNGFRDIRGASTTEQILLARMSKLQKSIACQPPRARLTWTRTSHYTQKLIHFDSQDESDAVK